MRFLFISILAHVFVLSFCLVGFSVPAPKDQNSFTFLGDFVVQSQQAQEDDRINQQSKDAEASMLPESSAAFFEPWVRMRQVDKPH